MKGLVVFFSHTGENMANGKLEVIEKGFTKVVAEKIARYTNSELYELKPVVAYPKNYEMCVSRARDEYENNREVEFENPKNNLNDYEIIFLGFPIWWRGYPRIISTFIKKHDGLKDKVVVPFCTNEEGAFGVSELELKGALKGADLRGGFVCRGNEVNSCDNKLLEFLKNIK